MLEFKPTKHLPSRIPLDYIVGILPHFFSESDPRTAQEQLQSSPGGPWNNFKSKWKFDPKDRSIKYPGDPKLLSMAEATLRSQTILVYEDAWVVILESDGSWQIDRRD